MFDVCETHAFAEIKSFDLSTFRAPLDFPCCLVVSFLCRSFVRSLCRSFFLSPCCVVASDREKKKRKRKTLLHFISFHFSLFFSRSDANAGPPPLHITSQRHTARTKEPARELPHRKAGQRPRGARRASRQCPLSRMSSDGITKFTSASRAQRTATGKWTTRWRQTSQTQMIS